MNSFVSFTPAKHRHSDEQVVEHIEKQVLGSSQRIRGASFMTGSLEPLLARAVHALRPSLEVTKSHIHFGLFYHSQIRAGNSP